MSVEWRWDQGRVEYWRFSHLRDIAVQIATRLDGANLHQHGSDPLITLRHETGLPFAIPANSDYRIWRQYGRVIQSALLASKIGDRLTATDICKRLAGVGGTPALLADEYLVLLATRFYFPSPAFGTYVPTNDRVFPFAALARYLIARHLVGEDPEIDVPEIFGRIIGNGVVGDENIEDLANLTDSGTRPANTDRSRQVREMMPLISQFSFLLWDGTRLRFDPRGRSRASLIELESILRPHKENQDDRDELELLALGRLSQDQTHRLQLVADAFSAPEDEIEFTEGARVRVTHLRAERNTALRRAFFDHLLRSRSPILCDMCAVDPRRRYPWTINLLEMHHLLPLGSTIRVEPSGTVFEDLVPMCPNCHRAVHAFYRTKLADANKLDFGDQAEAMSVYQEAKAQWRAE